MRGSSYLKLIVKKNSDEVDFEMNGNHVVYLPAPGIPLSHSVGVEQNWGSNQDLNLSTSKSHSPVSGYSDRIDEALYWSVSVLAA